MFKLVKQWILSVSKFEQPFLPFSFPLVIWQLWSPLFLWLWGGNNTSVWWGSWLCNCHWVRCHSFHCFCGFWRWGLSRVTLFTAQAVLTVIVIWVTLGAWLNIRVHFGHLLFYLSGFACNAYSDTMLLFFPNPFKSNKIWPFVNQPIREENAFSSSSLTGWQTWEPMSIKII